MSNKEDAFENLKEAWAEFCIEALCDKGRPGCFRGQAITIHSIGEFLLEHIEDNVDLTDDDEENEEDHESVEFVEGGDRDVD